MKNLKYINEDSSQNRGIMTAEMSNSLGHTQSNPSVYQNYQNATMRQGLPQGELGSGAQSPSSRDKGFEAAKNLTIQKAL